MAQTWHDLLFAHWPLPPGALRPLVPPGLMLDTFEGCAWIGVIPFRMSGVRLRRLPAVPGTAAFPELNVRTYVTDKPREDGGKPGVWFFSLDAASALAVRVARAWFSLPYHRATMRCEPDGADGIRYASKRRVRRAAGRAGPGRGTVATTARAATGGSGATGAAGFSARYRPAGAPAPARPGTLEHFLTERYCLYAKERRGGLRRAEIHHAPWPLQAAEAEIERNTMVAPLGLSLPDQTPQLHFARRLDVVVWTPELLNGP